MKLIPTLALALLLIAVPLLASPAVVAIDSPAPAGSAEPFLFAANDGLLLSWLEPVKGGAVALRFSKYRAGKWSAAQTVIQRGDLLANWADFPSIVQDEKGTLFAHWLQKNGGGYAYDIWFATSANGGRSWSKPLLLNRDGKKGEHGFVSLSPLPGGGAAVAWLDSRNMVEGKEEGDMSLRYATLDASGAIRGERQIDARTCECCTTGMAIADGRPVIVYRDRSAAEVRDIAFVRESARGWSSPALVHADEWTIKGCPVNGPQIDAAGKRMATAWFTAAKETPRVWAAFSDDAGATWSAPVAVDGGRPEGRVDVVTAADGSAIVTWMEKGAHGGAIMARRVARNGKAAEPVTVAQTSTARSAGFARIASIGPDLYVAWTEQNGTAKRIRVARVRM